MSLRALVLKLALGLVAATSSARTAKPTTSVTSKCAATLSVSAVTVTPGCWIDEKVSNRTATLSSACHDGPAEADFGVPFVGAVKEGHADLAATTTFDWGDGCTWQSKQRISGVLASGQLSYSYEEAPIKGTNCDASHCKGTATVVVK